jgi:hypothetical protein
MDVTVVSRAMPSSGAEEITRCGARQSAQLNVKVTASAAFLPVELPRASRLKRLLRHRSLCRHHLRGIADREVIAFPAHFEVALVKADDRRAMADGHDRRLR